MVAALHASTKRLVSGGGNLMRRPGLLLGLPLGCRSCGCWCRSGRCYRVAADVGTDLGNCWGCGWRLVWDRGNWVAERRGRWRKPKLTPKRGGTGVWECVKALFRTATLSFYTFPHPRAALTTSVAAVIGLGGFVRSASAVARTSTRLQPLPLVVVGWELGQNSQEPRPEGRGWLPTKPARRDARRQRPGRKTTDKPDAQEAATHRNQNRKRTGTPRNQKATGKQTQNP